MREEYVLSRKLLYAIYGVDELFITRAKQMNINSNEISLLYILDNDNIFSQKEISEQLYIPLSTVNTIVKKWEKDGLVLLSPVEGKRREMHVAFTPKGKAYAGQCLSCIYEAQAAAMEKTVEKYSPTFIEALEYFNLCQKQGITQE